MAGLHIVGTGRALPARQVSNEEMKQYVDTSDEWIASRTGIRSRFLSGEERNYQLAAQAAKRAIEAAGIGVEDIGLCIVATITGDYATPSVACMVQRELGLAEDIPAFDVNAACSGFLYGLGIAENMLRDPVRKYALIIGSEQLSRILDFTDRSTCVLFGDGAGAAVACIDNHKKFYYQLGARGDDTALFCPGIHKEDAYVHMDGQKVFRFAVSAIEQGMNRMLADSGYTLDEIDYVLCHQANRRIISHVQRKCKADASKFFMNLQKYGNTSGASIPLALDEMREQGLLVPGTKVICVGFGGGFTWGSALLEF